MIRREDLLKLRLLENFNDAELDMIRVVVEEELYEPNQVIISEGAPGEKLFLIVEGRVSVTTDIKGVGKEEITFLDAGESFGEISLIDRSPVSATVFARTKCRVFIIGRKAFERLIAADMPTANKLLRAFVKSFCERSRETASRIERLYKMSEFGGG